MDWVGLYSLRYNRPQYIMYSSVDENRNAYLSCALRYIKKIRSSKHRYSKI